MHAQRAILIVAIVLSAGYLWLNGAFVGIGVHAAPPAQTDARAQGLQKATLAAGCFWCTEADFEKLKGVTSAVSGYIGGRVPNPTYEQVSRGGTGHAEAVEIMFDPRVVSYEQLLEHYWKNVDPFVAHRQFCDVGDQYRPAIFTHTPEQRAAAEASKGRQQQKTRQKILVEVVAAAPFYRAEDYHQDYYKHHSLQYNYYRWRCGRDARLAEVARILGFAAGD